MNFSEGLLISIVIILILFLVFREVVCWYWKINELLKETKKTNDLLKKIYLLQGGDESILIQEEEEEIPDYKKYR